LIVAGEIDQAEDQAAHSRCGPGDLLGMQHRAIQIWYDDSTPA